MRLPTAALLTSMLLTSSCAGTYEHTVAGAGVGAVAGAMAGAMCCHNPIRDAGKGAIIGIVAGALIGIVIDWIDPV